MGTRENKFKSSEILCKHWQNFIISFILPELSSVSCNISKTSASVLPGFPNTRKLMKVRGRRPRPFIVFECLETPVKHEARVFETASQSAPNCKQKKKKENNRTKETKNHISM